MPAEPPDGRRSPDLTGAYAAGQPVWVYHTKWQPGVVLDASPRGVLVRYHHNGRALGVDTVLPSCVAPRDEPDPLVDEPAPRRVRIRDAAEFS